LGVGFAFAMAVSYVLRPYPYPIGVDRLFLGDPQLNEMEIDNRFCDGKKNQKNNISIIGKRKLMEK